MAHASLPVPPLMPIRLELLALVCGVAFFWQLGSVGLIGPDEPRYARVAWEMWTHGDWITTTLGETPWFEKPALLYWLIGLGYQVVGVNEWSARLPSAIAATLTVLILTGLRPVELGWTAALVTATSPLMLAFGRAATFEAILNLSVTASLFMFYLHYMAARQERTTAASLTWVLFYVFLGIGLLAKGLVGIVLPFGSLLVYALLTPDIRRHPRAFLRTMRPLSGLLITAAVAGVWYVPVIVRHGWTFVAEFFIAHHFQRFTSNRFRHPGPVYYYGPVIILGMLPWTPFLLVALYRNVRHLWRANDVEHTSQETCQSTFEKASQTLTQLALAAFTFPLLFFSFSGSKLPGYILPALPFGGLLAAYGFWSLSARVRTLWVGVAGLTQVGLYIGLQIAIHKILLEQTLDAVPFFAGGLLLTGLGVGALYVRQPAHTLFCLTGGMLGLVLWLTTYFPAIEAKFSSKGICSVIDRTARPGELVTFFGCREYAPVFYNPAQTSCCDAAREPYQLPNPAAVAAAVAERGGLLVVVPTARLAALRSSDYTLTSLGQAGRFTLVRLESTQPGKVGHD